MEQPVPSEDDARTGRAAGPGLGLGAWSAGALVFGSSAAVLVVEIVALRLLAPYLGLTLETSTAVIATALAAIAAGSWLGGRSADVVDPRVALAPLLGVSGAVVAVTPAVVRASGSWLDAALLPLAAGATIMVPGALLSAVTPMVTKLRLRDLDQTGTVVGRLSGIGTFGAIVGTVVTGFVLLSRLPVTAIMVGLGVLLVVSAVAVDVGVRRRLPVVPTVLVVLGGLGAAVAPGGCDAETQYHCAVVEADADRASGRTLWLDGLPHSYVDLADPLHLEWDYAEAVAAAVETTTAPAGEPLRSHFLGGGGLTLPRWLAQVRPGSRSTVSEIDAGVLAVDRERLGARTGEDLAVRIEDGRTGLERLRARSRDLVVGDAFGGVSVPWHLTTREALEEVRRVLTGEGVYAVNLIDRGPLDFARAEVATLREVFDHVVVASNPATVRRDALAGGNLVVLASSSSLDAAAWQRAMGERDLDWQALSGGALDRWVAGAPVLSDDFAPVDQLLTPYASR